MRSKLTRLLPEELNSLKLQEAKIILKKDIANLELLDENTPVSFYIDTNFTYKDKSKILPLLVLSEFKGAWKNFVKKETKPPAKFGLTGLCTLSVDPESQEKVLNLSITKGKPKSNKVETFIYKSKILPSNVKLNFSENFTLDADEEITAVDATQDANTLKEDKYYKKIVVLLKAYKALPLNEGKKRLKHIDKLLDLIQAWNKKNLPLDSNDEEGAARQQSLQTLAKQLRDHQQDIHVRSRQGEPITPIQEAWSTYQKRPAVAAEDVLSDLEDRQNTLYDIQAEIEAWIARNPAPLSKKEKVLLGDLDKLKQALEQELNRLQQALPKARVGYIKLMVEKIEKASPEELEKLKNDEFFMWELSRTVPVAQINDVRKLMGLPPVKEENGETVPFPENQEAWKDPEILAVFKDFAKFTTFETEKDHKDNPKLKKKVELLKGTWVWEDGKTAKDRFQLNKDTTFNLDSEDNKGNLKIEVNGKYFYVVKKDVAKETHYKVLPANTPLFPVPPNKNHVKQGGLGDCYFLAAITSLVNRDAQAIVDMMVDKGKTVTVRLFEVKIAKDGTQSFTAKYYNVDKSIPVNPNNQDAYARESLWVQMLEKAYAAGGFVGTTSKLVEQLKNNNHQGYADIAGGYASFSYQILTGQPAERLRFSINVGQNKDYAIKDVPIQERGKIEGNKKYEYQHLPWGAHEQKLFKVAGPSSYTKTVSYQIFNKDKTTTLKWWQYVQKGAIEQLFAREFFDEYRGAVTLEDLELLFQGKMKDNNGDEVKKLPVLEEGIKDTMMAWIKKEKLYSGKRGSGVYSTLQLNMYNAINTALTNKKLVAVNTNKQVGLSTDGKGHSAGESIAEGLVGGHAYTVLATREKAPLKELELRNPWAKTVQKNLTVKDALTDISARCQTVISEEIVLLTAKAKQIKALYDAADKSYQAEADPNKKAAFKQTMEVEQKKLQAVNQQLTDLRDPNKLFDFKGKITGRFAAYYNKQIPVVTKLKKLDPNKLISKTEDQSDEVGQDAGEFWLLLDDLTKRFNSICIG